MIYKYSKKIYTLLIAILTYIVATAAPARQIIASITQPDGTSLSIRLVGNEFCHYTETTDGVMVTTDSNGVWRYATQLKDGAIRPSIHLAHNSENRNQTELRFLSGIDQKHLRSSVNSSSRTADHTLSQTRSSLHQQGIYSTSTFPTKGKVNGLVFLVDFPDRSFSLDNDAIKEKYNKMLNQSGYKDSIMMNGRKIPGAYGSAKDYFEAQSFGQFSPTFNIVGPITADNGYAYYGRNDSNGYDEVHAAELIREIIQKAYSNNLVDFSEYDQDNNLEVDFIYVIYAGKGENYADADPFTIWPHQWVCECRVGDYRTNKYACSPEIYADVDNLIDGIGTFCHEFSHILGLPDFYPTSASSTAKSSTIREWSIMDYGCYDNYGFSPVGYTALERYSLGWMNLTEISSPGNYVLPAIDTAQTAYLLPSDKKLSYILLETHNKEGWYQYQPAEGLLVTTVDYNRNIWNANNVNNNANEQRYKVLAADNDYTDYTRNGDLFPYNGNDSLTLYSTPSTITGCGIPVNIPVMDIEYSNGVTTFSIISRNSTSINQNKVSTNAGISYSIANQSIILNSNTEARVTLYSITGEILYNATLQAGTDSAIPLPKRGIYLLRCNNKTYKIVY